MNKRFLKLATEAGLINDTANSITRNGLNLLELKFAELIVRDCALIADQAAECACEGIGDNVLVQYGITSK